MHLIHCSGFITRSATDAETLVAALQASQAAGCLSLSCMNFILASVEYEEFISLIADVQAALVWPVVSADAEGEPVEHDDKL